MKLRRIGVLIIAALLWSLTAVLILATASMIWSELVPAWRAGQIEQLEPVWVLNMRHDRFGIYGMVAAYLVVASAAATGALRLTHSVASQRDAVDVA